MKTLFQRVITVIVFLSLLLTPAPTGAAKSASAQISGPDRDEKIHLQGRVVDAPAQWKVRAFDSSGSLAAEAYTGLEGQFKFEPLPLDGYHLQVADELEHPVELSADTQVDFTPQELTQSPLVLLKPASAPAEPVVPIPQPADPTPPVQPHPMAADTGSISGTVTAALGGAPIQYAYIYAYDSPTASKYDYVDYAYTDVSGVYTISGLADGTYYLKFTNTGYVDSYFNAKASLAAADPVTVAGGGATSGINASLEFGGEITGTVTALSGGAPLQFAYVYAYTSRTATEYDYVASGYTNASGVYHLTGLATGTYYLRFERTDYLDSYYNGKTSLEEADGVSAAINTVTSNINAALNLGGKITGTVTAAAGGAALEDVYVYLYNDNTGEEWNYADIDFTDASGYYEFTGLAAGTYYLKFSRDDYLTVFYNNKSTLASADGIAVALNSTSTANAALVLGGKITGTITAAQGGAPLESVFVSLYDSPTDDVNDYLTYAFTNASGVYTINRLPTGTYYLRFSKTDYITRFYNDKGSLTEADAIPVTIGETVTRNGALHVAGKISGTVTAASGGAALQGVYVYAYTSRTADYWDYAADTTTDAAGKYTLSDLVGGTYFLKFEKADYLDSYYNDKASLAEADEVTAALDTETQNINAALDLGGKISGTVTAVVGGAALKDVNVYAYASRSSGSWEYVSDASTDAAGIYTLTGLPTGTYYIKFEKTDYLTGYYDGKTTLAAADGVSTAVNTETGNIDIALNVGGRISGTVTAEVGGAVLEDVDVKIYARQLVCGRSMWVFIDSATTDASGYYTVSGLSGGQYLAWFDPSSYGVSASYMDEYYNNKPNMDTANPINVAIGQTTDHINAALIKGGTITGTVTGADGGSPLEDVDVELYYPNGSYYDDVYTDASGVYSITALPAGNYKVKFRTAYWASSAPYVAEYYNDKTDLASSNSVTVPASTEVNHIDAVLARGARITGQVTAADGGAALEDVYVDVYDSQGDYVTWAQTDSSGMYLTPGMPTGSYRLYIYPWGASEDYLGEYYNDKASLSTANPVAVTAPAQTTINAALTRGGSISGTVTSSITQAPLENVYVVAIDAQGWDVDWAYTDSNGEYTLQGLPGGGYRVLFDYYVCSFDFYIFYHQKLTLATADIVIVTPPANVTSIDDQLPIPAEINITSCYLPVLNR